MPRIHDTRVRQLDWRHRAGGGRVEQGVGADHDRALLPRRARGPRRRTTRPRRGSASAGPRPRAPRPRRPPRRRRRTRRARRPAGAVRRGRCRRRRTRSSTSHPSRRWSCVTAMPSRSRWSAGARVGPGPLGDVVAVDHEQRRRGDFSIASMPAGDAATTPGGTVGATRRGERLLPDAGDALGRRRRRPPVAGTAALVRLDPRAQRVELRRRVVAVAAVASARLARVAARRGATASCSICAVSVRDLGARAWRRSSSSARARCRFARERAARSSSTSALRLSQLRCERLRLGGARRCVVGVGLLLACAAARRSLAQLLARRASASASAVGRAVVGAAARLLELGELAIRARAPRPASPRSRRSNASNATTSPSPKSAPAGPARPQRRREQRAGRRARPSPRRAPTDRRRAHCASTRGDCGCAPNRASTRSRKPVIFVERPAQLSAARARAAGRGGRIRAGAGASAGTSSASSARSVSAAASSSGVQQRVRDGRARGPGPLRHAARRACVERAGRGAGPYTDRLTDRRPRGSACRRATRTSPWTRKATAT